MNDQKHTLVPEVFYWNQGTKSNSFRLTEKYASPNDLKSPRTLLVYSYRATEVSEKHKCTVIRKRLYSLRSNEAIEDLYDGHVGWQENEIFFHNKKHFFPRGIEFFCSCHPTWPPCKPSIIYIYNFYSAYT